MDIGKVSSIRFGAMPDINTRMIFKTAKMKDIDTTSLEDTMKEVYADKYIMTNIKPDGITLVGIYSKEEGAVDLVRPLMSFNNRTDGIASIIRGLTSVMAAVKKERSEEQIVIDHIENKFGRYDEPNAYKHARCYVA